MKLKKLFKIVISLALAASMIVLPVYADEPTLEQQRDQAQAQRDQLQADLNQIVRDKNDLQLQLQDLGARITQTEANLAEAEARREQQQADMALRIRYMYENGNTSALERILSADSIAGMLTQAEYFQKIQAADRAMLEDFANTVQSIKDLQASLKEEQANLEAKDEEYRARADELETMIANSDMEVATLNEMIQEAARIAAEEAARAEAERLRQEEEARIAAEEEARRQEEANQANQNNTNNNSNSQGDTTTSTPPITGGNPSFVAPENASAAEIIVAAAMSQLGVPYVWGGSTPGVGFDCSGLTQWAHAQAGISIPRTDATQLAAGMLVTDPLPGDIVWTPGHVAIYLGGGQMVEAPQSGWPVMVSALRGNTFVRFW